MPSLWADPGDAILAPGQTSFDPAAVTRCSPWGWSADARRQFINAGVSPDILPSDADIMRMRMLSHRRSSVILLNLIDLPHLAAREITDPRLVVEAEQASPGIWLKTPWSCSGRGVMCASSLDPDALLRRAAGIIHRQGSVMVEKGLTGKLLDFAALFTAHSGGTVTFDGWSVFRAEPRGAYCGNVVLPDDELLALILSTGHDPRPFIPALTSALSAHIGGTYVGPLGIDMMIHSGGIHPCIELNLRRTMGTVARSLALQRHRGLLAWEHTSRPSGTPLLTPAFGFALTLSPL